MIFALGMAFELDAVEIDLAQISGAVPFGLVVEMRGGRMAAFAARGDRQSPHFIAELNDGDEAVSGCSVPFFGAWISMGCERCQRSPEGVRETDGNAGGVVAERLNDIAGQPLEAVDVAPLGLPSPEVHCELVRCGREGFE